jgi:YhcH/YjgK/YiaL family protein
MIIDHITHAHLYFCLHPHFAEAFRFLQQVSPGDFLHKRIDIDGDNLFALFQEGVATENNRMEVHRQYIDIQYVFSGYDKIGWKNLQSCLYPIKQFNESLDYQLYNDQPSDFFILSEGKFAVFFPNDAHAPLAGTESYYKVVMKVLVNHKTYGQTE